MPFGDQTGMELRGVVAVWSERYTLSRESFPTCLNFETLVDVFTHLK